MHIKFVQNKSQTRHRLVLAAKPYLSTLRCLLKDCICSKNSWLNCTRYLSIVSYGCVCFFTPVVLLTLHSFCLPTNFIKICSSNNTAPLISFKTSIIVCLTIQYIIFSVFACLQLSIHSNLFSHCFLSVPCAQNKNKKDKTFSSNKNYIDLSSLSRKL